MVIGDGVMSAGMAYVFMKNAYRLGTAVVILNDNDMSIALLVGGLSADLARTVPSQPVHRVRGFARASKLAKKLFQPLVDHGEGRGSRPRTAVPGTLLRNWGRRR